MQVRQGGQHRVLRTSAPVDPDLVARSIWH